MKDQTEVELKFLVPSSTRSAVLAEITRRAAALERSSLAALYIDTPDRRLARAGLAWRLRREGRRWIQTLKAGGSNPLERFEHEVIRPDASQDAVLHRGTAAGDRLLAQLARARADGREPGVRFRTEFRRTSRRIRTRGALVEVSFDDGRIVAATARARIQEIEFELISGSVPAMLALAERWRRKFGLIYDPRSKAERGDRLAAGLPCPEVRKAIRPAYLRHASASEAFQEVLDECLSQLTRNAMGLMEGDPALRVEYTHQARVGIRRLRSALRCFRGWVPMPPDDLVENLKALFEALGRSRDSDVLKSGVARELSLAGAPAVNFQVTGHPIDPAQACRSPEVQRTLIAWIAWRSTLGGPEPSPQPCAEQSRTGTSPAETQPVEPVALVAPIADPAEPTGLASPSSEPTDGTSVVALGPAAAHRLRRWHKAIVRDWKRFDTLDENALHALRKRVKRQRYAVEFFASLLPGRKIDRYLRLLGDIQDQMGELNDLFVARARYSALVDTQKQAWFALGWLEARIAAVRAQAEPALGRLARAAPPAGRGMPAA